MGDQWLGRPFSEEMPRACAPRNAGQSVCAFVVTAVLVAVRGLPELKSLLARGRGSGGSDQESESP